MDSALHRILCGSELALSFSGCGFLGTYHFGVLSCLTQKAKRLMKRMKRCAGASAGSLFAAVVVLNPKKVQEGLEALYDTADEMAELRFGALTPGFSMHEKLVKLIDRHLPEDISTAQDRLFVSVTHYTSRRNRIICRFPSRDYLIQCLAASCFIPYYSLGMTHIASVPVIDGEAYVDGGYTNNLPVFDDIPTLTVSPFSGNAHISPRDYISSFTWRTEFVRQQFLVNVPNLKRGVHAFFPPPNAILRTYFDAGYTDALDFLASKGLLERNENGKI